MVRLALSVLGPFQAILEGVTITCFHYDKVRALLIYLAVEADRPHRRESLAELLWPDQDDRTARHSLSQALFCLRKAIDDRLSAPFLLLTRDSVQFNRSSDHWLDLTAFLDLLDACEQHPHRRGQICWQCAQRLDQAKDLYRGSFLEQFSIADSAAFDEWATVKREGLHQRAVQVLDQLVDYYEWSGALAEAASRAQRQIALAPCHEAAHRRFMRILARSGQRRAAMAQYQRCRQILADEVGVPPEPDTTELYQRIRDGVERSRVATLLSSPAVPRYELPPQPTPFVGRHVELARLATLLSDPGCPLVTLTGPGGIGKTRLGIEAARRAADAVADGACFVPLAGLHSPSLLVPTIAHALALTLYSKEDPKKQLLGYLQERELLLILDNFEHLIEGAGLISQILKRAPRVRILVTSRERLNLQGEWVVDVEGLDVPAEDEASGIGDSSAVQLFVQSACRAKSGFSPSSDDVRVVARICRLVGGMPLGIELSAAWVPVLSLEEIAQEIENSIDFLTAEVRDVPKRHRSIRAVFDHSWQMLDVHEQRVLARLSVFRGGFRREAAEQVVGRSLPILSALTSKSLLRRNASGHYELHELLRQYAESRLDATPEEAVDARSQHATYYGSFLEQNVEPLKGGHLEAALRDVSSEIENVHAAWHWAVQNGRADIIARAVHGLWLFSEITGRYDAARAAFGEAAAVLEMPANALDSNDVTRALALGRVLTDLGSFAARVGNHEQGSALITESITILRQVGTPADLGLALNFKAMYAHARQDYLGEQQDLQESIRCFTAANDNWGLAYSMNDLGLAAFLLGDSVEAKRLCQQSLDTFIEIGDKRGMAFALKNLGVITGELGDYSEARQNLTACLETYRSIGHRWGTADALSRLGVVSRSTGDYDESLDCLLAALRTAVDINAMALALEVLLELAGSLAPVGKREQAIVILGSIAHHPAGGPVIWDRARHLLDHLGVCSIPEFSQEKCIQVIQEQVRFLLQDSTVRKNSRTEESSTVVRRAS
jgi:predicted ATPase/DNA-binding SARP family transcriptional activator